LRRRIRVSLDEINIVDDGADGDTQASFKIWVLNGVLLKNRFDVPELEISDSPSPGRESEEYIELAAIGPPVDVVIGPEAVTQEKLHRNDSLAIFTRGIANVPLGEDHISGNFLPGPPVSSGDPSEAFSGTIFDGATFAIPFGAASEIVDRAPFSVRAMPLSDHEFTYDVSVTISIDYR